MSEVWPILGFFAAILTYASVMQWIGRAYRADPTRPIIRRLEWFRCMIANEPLPGERPDR